MRFEQYQRGDNQDATGGDNGWTGINNTLDKPNLPAGYLSVGENTRCRQGRVRQRKGTFAPGDFNPTAGFGAYLVGSGVFRDPNGQELLVVAPASNAYTWCLAHGKDPFQISYGTGTGDNGPGGGINGVQFVQGFDKFILLRRPLVGSDNLVWDGDPTHTWDVMTLSATGSTLIPGMFNGEPFQDRIIYYRGNAPGVSVRDEWIMSDIEDYSSYQPVGQDIRSNPAEADFITRILSYLQGSVVIFKNQSILMAQIALGVYPVQTSQRILNRSIGAVGNKMPLMVGGDVLFASMPNGFYSLSQVIQDNIITLPAPISEPIQKVIDQINWPIMVQMGCSAALDNYAFFGVALGRGATRLNAILVYDTQRQQWESAGDTWADPSFAFNALHLTNYNNVQRLFAVDYVTGTIYLLYEGLTDELYSGSFNVPFKMETRGYVGDDPLAFKKFGRMSIGISTYNPNCTVTALTDGFNEEKQIAVITKNRNRFYQFGHKDFDAATDDPTEQKREDYSIAPIDDVASDDFEDLPDGPIQFIPATDAPVPGPLQETLERFIVRSFGRWAAVRLENDGGAIEVTAVGIESTRAANTVRTAA